MDKLIRARVEKGLCGEVLAVGMELAKTSALVLRAWKRDVKLFLENPVMAGLRDGSSRLVLTWLASPVTEPS